MIIAKGLTKEFISYQKRPGLLGSISSLYKREYTTKQAVNSFDLEIKKGEIIGLLGPNGAGKTTLMKMFTGIIVPSHGQLEVLGFKPFERHKEFRKKIALVMGQKSQLWWDIPALDSFLLLQKYYEVPQKQFKERLDYMAELLDVQRLLEVHVRKLSLGERMKMELMASLLHNPEVIFLDEPTIGLDLVAQEKIRQFVKDFQKEHQTTIILTSHYMADVSELCQRLVLIFEGQKAFDGAISEFENFLGNEKSITFHFEESINQRTPFDKFSPKWNPEFTQVELRMPIEGLRQDCIEILKNFPVTDFASDNVPIENVMKTLLNNPEILVGKNNH